MFLTQFYHRYKLTSSDVNLFALKKKIKCIINLARCAFSFWCFYWDLFLFFVCVIRSTICGLSVKISAWFLDLINPRGFHFILIFFKGNQSKARSGPDRHWQALLFSPCPAEQTADRRLYREDWKLSWVSISSSSVDTTFNIKPHKNAFDVQSSEIRLRCFLLYLAQIQTSRRPRRALKCECL